MTEALKSSCERSNLDFLVYLLTPWGHDLRFGLPLPMLHNAVCRVLAEAEAAEPEIVEVAEAPAAAPDAPAEAPAPAPKKHTPTRDWDRKPLFSITNSVEATG